MAVDSNKPYQRVNVQANNNDTIWNGAAWGAGAGIGAMGLTYGATKFGARGIDTLASKAAGSKTTRMQTRMAKRAVPDTEGLQMGIDKVINRQLGVHTAMGKVQGAGDFMFGSGKGTKRAAIAGAAGLMGGMLAGGAIDHFN